MGTLILTLLEDLGWVSSHYEDSLFGILVNEGSARVCLSIPALRHYHSLPLVWLPSFVRHGLAALVECCTVPLHVGLMSQMQLMQPLKEKTKGAPEKVVLHCQTESFT